MIVPIKFKKLSPSAVIPQYAHGPRDDAGMDLVAVEDVALFPDNPTLVKTGLSLELPSFVEAQVRPRSGLALKHGITVWNSPGTVDPGYRGELGVVLYWSPTRHMLETWDYSIEAELVYRIKAGDRIAQIVFAPYVAVEPYEDGTLSESNRGEGGFGSTGLSVKLDERNGRFEVLL